MMRWRAGVCLFVVLAVTACAINLAPAEDILLAATEDERDNVLGRLLTEHGPRLAPSQKTRRESEETSGPADDPSSFFPDRIRQTLRRIRDRFSRQGLRSADAQIIENGVSLRDLPSLRGTAAPIVAGPWLSEVGFELLYWIPFLRWAASEYDLHPGRIIAVSRGGASTWYSDVASRFVDVFDYVGTEEYRERLEQRARVNGHQKQFEQSEFDRTLVDRITSGLNLADAVVIHPSVMYQLFRRYWNEKAPVGILTSHTRWAPLPDPGPFQDLTVLPKDFVAVRFYFRPSFRDTPDNRQFVARVIRRLTRRHPVVLLNTGLQVDDHEDFDLLHEPGVFRLDNWMTPTNNLAVQSQIISRATAFVGTYGGLSYLGPYYGVPTMTFYSEPDELVTAHVDAAWRLSRTMRSSLTILSVNDAALIASTFDGSNG